MFSCIPDNKKYFHIHNILAVFVFLALCSSVHFTQTPPHPRLREKIASGKITIPKIISSDNITLSKDLPPNTSLSQTSPAKLYPWQNSTNGSSSKGFNLLVVLVDFQDKPHSVQAEYFDHLIFSSSTFSLKDYFNEVSYGKMNITAVNLPSQLGWIRAPETYSYYTSGGSYGSGSYPNNTQKLAEDIVKKLDPYVDFSKYDNDRDGYVDGLIIVHSGKGAEYTGDNSDIWSYASSMLPLSCDGVSIYRYAICPEYYADSKGDMTIGSFAHEFSHSYFGLIDLYDSDYSSRGLGKWSLMSDGCWNGLSTVGGDMPAHPDAYCMVHMGFAKVQQRSFDSRNIAVKPVESDSMQVYKVWYDEMYVEREYFLIENRVKKGFDQCLPGEGLLIYHVDDNATGNLNEWYPSHTSSGHYKISLVQADNRWDLEKNVNNGDDGDPYPGSKNNTEFTALTSPDSKSYNGKISEVEIKNIRRNGDTIIADINPGRIYQGDLAIISPAKGERVRAGNYYPLRWYSKYVSRIALQFSSDAGRNWTPVASNLDNVTQMYWWNVPRVHSDSCKIRISDLAYTANFGESGIFSLCDRPISARAAIKGDLAFTQVITGKFEGFELLVLSDIDVSGLKAANLSLSYDTIVPQDKVLIDMSKISLDCYAVASQGTYIRFVKDTTPGYSIDAADKILTIYYAPPAGYPSDRPLLNLSSAPLTIYHDDPAGIMPVAGFNLNFNTSNINNLYFCLNTPPVLFPPGMFSNYWFREPITDYAGNVVNAVRMPENWAADNSQSGFIEKAIKFSDSDGTPVNLRCEYKDYFVKVDWSVIEERYNQGWQIERRTLNTDWAPVGFIASKGRYNGTARPYTFTDKSVVPPETYYYRLRMINPNSNNSGCSHIIKLPVTLSSSYVLEQNYPNPFNGSTTVFFSLPALSSVRFTIYNSLGQIIRDDDMGIIPAGVNKINISLDKLSSGIYFYTLKATSQTDQSTFVQSKKMTVVK